MNQQQIREHELDQGFLSDQQQIREHELDQGFLPDQQQIREHELDQGFLCLFFDTKARTLLSTMKKQSSTSPGDNNFIFGITVPEHGATHSAILFLNNV